MQMKIGGEVATIRLRDRGLLKVAGTIGPLGIPGPPGMIVAGTD